MKIEIVTTNDENFNLIPQNYAEIQPQIEVEEEKVVEPPKQEEVVETPQPLPQNPSYPVKQPVPFHNQVESMKWL